MPEHPYTYDMHWPKGVELKDAVNFKHPCTVYHVQ